MIDVAAESLVSLNNAVKLLPRRRAGRPVHVSTLHRWVTAGVRGVRLEIIQIGGTRCTSREALQRFFERLTTNPTTSPTSTTSRAVQREHDAAEKRLHAAGI